MQGVHPPKLYYGAIFLVALVAAAASIYYYDGFLWQSWPQLLVFTILIAYFHWFPVDFGGKVSYSLGTAAICPIICLMGASEVMSLAALGALVDGYVGKKSWERVLFNVSQSALSGLVGHLLYKGLGGAPLPIFPANLKAIIFGGLGYILTNILIVTAMVAIRLRRSWRTQLALWGLPGLLISLANGYIGIIFTLFAAGYGLPGLALFAVLLIQLSTLLRVGAVVKGEREVRKELEYELIVDEMTKVYNFRYLNEWLASSQEKQVAALFLDIDDFKLFNDRYGHAEGDRVLRLLAETVKKSVRAADGVIRYGGEEFVVLLPGMESQGATEIALRIQANLKKLPYARWKQPITISIGIASLPTDTKDRRQLLTLADQAMYAAKKAGKNTFRLWEKEGLA